MDDKQFDAAVAHIRQHQRKLYVAVNTYPQPQGWERWQSTVDRAADHGVD
ncbi:U32 family peptidase, partial [Pseudomonas frederiksbergensis]|nr:U32 family peptidase [Pseudomonas frederiksbergensis]